MVPKFRAWLKYDKEMKNVLAFDTRGYSFLGIEGPHVTVDGWCDNFEVGKQAVLMQSTGLKDKNGVEIFEGDVVSLTEGECSYSGIVVRDYYEFYIKGIGSRDCFDFQDVSNTFDGTTSLEVTTNIYKNPELLEKANEN